MVVKRLKPISQDVRLLWLYPSETQEVWAIALDADSAHLKSRGQWGYSV